MDWHEIAEALIGLLIAIGGWVWTRVVAQVDGLRKDFDQHARSDNKEFADLNEKINENQVALLNRISGRWNDRS